MTVGTRSVFEVTARDPKCRARCGKLTTAHAVVETPVFMPVATLGSVKALDQEDLKLLGVKAILANSYHLYLRPGADVVSDAGGLHRFMNYDGNILTDSGGYQVFSLAGLRVVNDDSVTFQSHLDGSRHTLTPESVVRLQSALGSDIWTVLDECPPYPCSRETARKALDRTMRWAERSIAVFEEEVQKHEKRRLLFPILQGSMDPALRREGAAHLASLKHDGVCLGGFSVGEEKSMTWDILALTTEHLPADAPRYLMGMGAPEDLWEAVRHGVDMLDCVWPTRIARNGNVMTSSGRFNIKNTPFRKDYTPIDATCSCYTCKRYSRAYLSHLFRSKELSAYRLLTLHNLHFSMSIMREIRCAIQEGRFETARAEFLDRYRGNS